MPPIDESPGGTDVNLDPGTVRVLHGLRLVLVAKDRERAERLGAALAAMHVTVEVIDASSKADVTAARGLDPEVVLIDPTALGGAGTSLNRTLIADERLRWASVLRCELDKLWAKDEERPNFWRLASLLAPLVNAERSLRERVKSEATLVTDLDRIGPNRALRVLESSGGAYAFTAQSPDARAELMIDHGQVVTATYDELHVSGPPVNGKAAVSRFLMMRSGVLEVVRIGTASWDGDDVTSKMGPPLELLRASRHPQADDETQKMAPVTDAALLARDAEELPGEPTIATEKRKAESDHPTAPMPQVLFPLPELFDDPFDEVTKTDDSTYPMDEDADADGEQNAIEEAAAAPEQPASEPAPGDVAPSASPGEPAPPMPPTPRVSPREGAARGSLPPVKEVRVGADADSAKTKKPEAAASTAEPEAAASTARPEVERKPSAPASSSRPVLMLGAAVVGVFAMIAIGVVVWAARSGDEGGSPQQTPEPVAALATPQSDTPAQAGVAVTESDRAVPEQVLVPEADEEAPSPEDEAAPTPADTPSEATPTPEDPSLTPRQRADRIVDRAAALAMPEAAEEALTLYEEALSIDPVNARALAGVAQVHLARDRAGRALAPASRAVGLAPNRPSYRILLGDVHFALGDQDAARAIWLETYAVRPTARLRRRLARVGHVVTEPGAGEGTESGGGTPLEEGAANGSE